MSTIRLLQTAFEYVKKRDYDEAKKLLYGIINLAKDNSDVYHLLAIIELETNNFDKSIDYFKKGYSLNPVNDYFYLNYGIALIKNNDYAKAIEILTIAVKRKDNFDEAKFNLGNAFKFIKNYKLAINIYNEILNNSPFKSLSLNNMGLCYYSMNDIDQSINLYNDAIKLNDKFYEAYSNKGNSLFSKGKYLEALNEYDNSLLINPNYSLALANKGITLQKLQLYEEAIIQFKAALKINPNLSNISIALAALEQKNIPTIAPQNYVEELFDRYADNFDDDLINQLNYKSPKLLYQRYQKLSNNSNINILDLGCGTGLCGEEFKKISNKLIGVDLSTEMLKKAAHRQIYSELIQSDICDYMKNSNTKFELILCADVLVYMGDLSSFFSLIKKCLNNNGVCLFTIESSQSNTFELKNSQRYGHSLEYISSLTLNNNLTLIDSIKSVLRNDKGVGVEGYIVTVMN